MRYVLLIYNQWGTLELIISDNWVSGQEILYWIEDNTDTVEYLCGNGFTWDIKKVTKAGDIV